ncbi:MAG: selenocysteine-specific translation elongation factor [Desulfohalobiaceae bacterium]
MPVIMGTAGHIDHGKTTLIKALSGIDCDRLKDEKKRGITIELGFAYLDLPDGQRLGIVDVPGHEKFVKNMVAGAAGIDFVLLTVAADEGIMPQTREHLEICSLLGIKQGLVALTKIDMVDEELLELAQEDVQDYLSSTFLAGAPVIPVSAHTSQGVPELTRALQEYAAISSSKQDSDLFRLPVDRVFTMRGYGTVITGTLLSGQIQTGEPITVYPHQLKSKVRNLQVHTQSVQSAHAGQRTAMNLSGLEVEDLERGDCLARPGTLFPRQLWDIEISCLPSAHKALRHRREIHFHHGSRETLARVHLLDREELKPGETALAQVRFPEPMVGVYLDRYVIRSFSPLRTIAGGKVLNPLAERIKRHSPKLELLLALAQEDPQQTLLTQLKLAGTRGLNMSQLQVTCAQPLKALHRLLQDLASRQQVFLFDREDQRYIHQEVLKELNSSLLEYVRRFHEQNPLQAGLSRGMLTSDWGRSLWPKLVHFLLERCLKKGELENEQELIRLPGHQVSLKGEQSQLRDRLLQAYERAGLEPPNLNALLQELGTDKKSATLILKVLTEEGRLVKVKEELYFSPAALERIKSLVQEYFQDKSELTPPDFKELTGLSRKYSIPLLEYLDRQKVTIRVGDVRKPRKG